MNSDFHPRYAQLFHQMQLSLHRYHLSVETLLEAIHKRDEDPHFVTKIQQLSTYTKDSLADIQSIQLKKLQLIYKQKPSYQDFASSKQSIPKEQTDASDTNTIKQMDIPLKHEEPESLKNIPPKQEEPESLKNMSLFRSILHGKKTKIFIEEVQPLPPWRPNSY